MTGPTIPILAYAFIGITTLVLTYATFMDNGNAKPSNSSSMTSLLPSLTNTTGSSSAAGTSSPSTPASTQPSSPISFPISQPSGPPRPEIKIGGKTKRKHNKNKKTKRHAS